MAIAGAVAPALAQEPNVAASTLSENSASGDAIGVLQVRPDVYMLTVDGRNVAVQAGVNGTIVVDTGPPGRADAVLKAIKGLTNGPIRFVIDTSADADRVGNNAEVAAAGMSFIPQSRAGGVVPAPTGAPIIAYQNVVTKMLGSSAGGATEHSSDALPTQVYTRPQYNFYLNGQGIEVLWQPAAHSSGDSVVLFRRSDVLVTGDVFDDTRFPVIDIADGGSIRGEIDALNRLLEAAIPVTPLVWEEGGTAVIPARGPQCDQEELLQYRDMLVIIRDRIQYLVNQGENLEQVQASMPTAGYTRRYGSNTGTWTTNMFVEAVYNSLKPVKRSGGSG